MRTFIAIDLDPELKRSLQALVGKLKETGAEVRWAGLQAMHLTLKFLGETDPEMAAAVAEALRGAVARHARFRLELRGTGFFPCGRTPRVLWAGLAAGPELAALQSDVEAAMEGLGFQREDRPFHPHQTLGRVKGPAHLRDALAELEKYRDVAFGEMEARKVTLFQSILKPEGAEYRAIEEFELG